MSAQKHTLAPWEVSHGGHGSPSGFVIDEYFVLNPAVADDVAIAADIIDPATGMPSEANARLIAAAPELLEALIKADQMFRDVGFIAEADRLRPGSLGSEIRDAIAKATGGAA
jgi:hypothetical protein